MDFVVSTVRKDRTDLTAGTRVIGLVHIWDNVREITWCGRKMPGRVSFQAALLSEVDCERCQARLRNGTRGAYRRR